VQSRHRIPAGNRAWSFGNRRIDDRVKFLNEDCPMPITNPKLKDYHFLQGMYADSFFPDFLVDKGVAILVRLCERIESEKPETDADVYKLTHAATEEFNKLADEFYANESEIETAARETICEDFAFIARAYGYDLDRGELVAPRDW
jgi:hypothetical protein